MRAPILDLSDYPLYRVVPSQEEEGTYDVEVRTGAPEDNNWCAIAFSCVSREVAADIIVGLHSDGFRK